MTTRRTITIRLSDDGIAELDRIAARDHEGNRSMALRRALTLGLKTLTGKP